MPRQIPLNLRPNETPSYDNFVETQANRDALTLLKAWPNWPSSVLRLYGPEGCGKTHLGQAWANHSGGTFIDDAEDQEEETLFNLINRALVGDIPGLLIASGLPLKDWGIDMPDLRSRLSAAPEATLLEPDDESLEPIMRRLFEQCGRAVSRDVVEYLLKHADRSVNALRVLIGELDLAAGTAKADLTKAFVAKYLKANSR